MHRPTSQLLDDPAWSLTGYMNGHFPLYDLRDRFYWERLPERAVLPINAETARRAASLSRRAHKRFTFHKNRHFAACIKHLQDPRIKEYSWVRAEVVRIYKALRSAGVLLTLEALNARGQLAGGLVGIVLPGVFIAETMFSLEPDASKICLCQLVRELAGLNFRLLDTQSRHDRDPWTHEPPPPGQTQHPCVRLGEEVWPVARFMTTFTATLADSGATTPADWVAQARHLASASRAFRQSPVAAATLRQEIAADPRLMQAFHWLQITLPPVFVAAVVS